MSLIDATARFEARREAARRQNGEFGEQEHSAPELTLQEVFEEMNELGELGSDSDLTAPIRDTYTGSAEERESAERTRELNDLLNRAGIDRDSLSEKTLGDIQNGIARRQADRKLGAEYRARQEAERSAREAHDLAVMHPTQRQVYETVTSLIEAAGGDRHEYHIDSIEYLTEWARNATTAEVMEEIAQRREEKTQRDLEDRESQLTNLGPVTDEVIDEAWMEDRLRAQQQIRRLRPTAFVGAKETNQVIRTSLAKAYPGVKFSVRASGSSTHISWEDGPTESEIDGSTWPFRNASFDGMTDSETITNTPGFDGDGIPVSISYSSNYVFSSRDFSDRMKAQAEKFISDAIQRETGEPYDRHRMYQTPQALYALANEENGGQNGYSFTFRGQDQWGDGLVRTAASMLAAQEYAKVKPSRQPVDLTDQAENPHTVVKNFSFR